MKPSRGIVFVLAVVCITQSASAQAEPYHPARHVSGTLRAWGSEFDCAGSAMLRDASLCKDASYFGVGGQ